MQPVRRLETLPDWVSDPAVAAIMAVGRAEVGEEKRKAREVLIL